MKIALVGTIESPINRKSIAGTEVWTYNFAEELVKRGYQVTLFASSQSRCSGKLVVVSDRSDILNSRTGSFQKEKLDTFSVNEMIQVIKRSEEFDLIHLSAFRFYLYLPMVKFVQKSVVITVHGSPLEAVDAKTIDAKFSEANYAMVSKSCGSVWPDSSRKRVIYNGIKTNDFPFCDKKNNYYFWMGRLVANKGVEDAIAFAQETKSKLFIAGPLGEKSYFKKNVEPFLNDRIKYLGELDHAKKVKYYQGAKAFLMPIKWEEPFGLVVVEAMSCGTPVIAYKRGAMDEIINDGVDGFLVKPNSIQGIIDASKRLDQIDKTKCRKKVDDYFTVEKMVDGYEEVYRKVIEDFRKKKD